MNFLLKKYLKNSRIVLAISLFLFLAILYYSLNQLEQKNQSFEARVTQDIKQVDDLLIAAYKKDLSDPKFRASVTEKDLISMEEAQKEAEEWSRKLKQIKHAAQQKDWKKALALKQEVMIFEKNMQKNAVSEGLGQDPTQRAHEEQVNEVKFQQLMKRSLAPDTETIEVYSFNFIYRVTDFLFPTLFLFLVILILTMVNGGRFQKGVDIEQLESKRLFETNVRKNLLTASVIFLMYLSILGVLFVGTHIFGQAGSSFYPIVLEKSLQSMFVSDVLLRVLFLQFFALLFLCTLYHLVLSIVKNTTTTMFLMLVSLLSPYFFSYDSLILTSLGHLLPTTYFRSAEVVSERLAYYSQAGISFWNGVFVLAISSAVLMIGQVSYNFYVNKRLVWRYKEVE